ncbi:hypothetical protein L950_0222705 [Sphingobacterium sp. IITKGP-BTPF85]|nr:hypothetical protein L950_0222705 [Sphingobacterium sp. IITKGP-BTPF85]
MLCKEILVFEKDIFKLGQTKTISIKSYRKNNPMTEKQIKQRWIDIKREN